MRLLHVTIFILAVSLALLPVTTFSQDEVDLRGKKGIIDPQDLKKHDPKERSLKIKEPPPPPPPRDEVDRGGIDDSHVDLPDHQDIEGLSDTLSED